jgi:hypothetical protein
MIVLLIFASAIALWLIVRLIDWNQTIPLKLRPPRIPRSTLSSTRKRRNHLLQRRN